jgi:uncharacterized Zn finger protein
MKLKSFETEVERKIVERGFEYHKSGDVKKLEKVGETEFSATVFGTENTAFTSK